MPTGYIAGVEDGTITEFADFALICARAFGPLILLRDSEWGPEATRRLIESEAYLRTSSYNENGLAAARARLAELEAMSDEEALEASRQDSLHVVEAHAEINSERKGRLDRYQQMLAKVESWESPSPDHADFEQFMVDSLRHEIDQARDPYIGTVPEVSIEWRDREIAYQQEEISRRLTAIKEEEELNAFRRRWVEALVASLPAE